MINKLAVYGTLRNGKRKTYKINGFSLVYPGHYRYPAAIINNNSTGMVIELLDVEQEDINGYDIYESVDSGLYDRRKVTVYENDKEINAWMYTAGPLLLQHKTVFELVPEQDWLSKKSKKKRILT
mgnify:CR=1 FL=1